MRGSQQFLDRHVAVRARSRDEAWRRFSMRVFLYEAITGGGWFRLGVDEPLSGSLLSEGRAMACALRDDLLRIPGCEVLALSDDRASLDGSPWWRVGLEDASSRVAGYPVACSSEHDALFDQSVRESTAVILVAPELGGMLADLARQVQLLGGNLRSPSRDFVRLTGDKNRLAGFLAASGIPTPSSHRVCSRTMDCVDWQAILARSPCWVLKPNEGAGSMGIHRWPVEQVRRETLRTLDAEPDEVWCLQEYRPGRAASVAAILDGPRWTLLPPCWQWLDDETFAYRGGAVIEEETLVRRAWRLAERVVASLPETQGYIGMDLVLAADPRGSEDALIEVNPRLTTSYVGLRRAVACNLAAAMLEGLTPGSPRYRDRQRRVQFDAEGVVTVVGGDGGMASSRAEEAGS
jgi:predicted ATP-grasp superfamily ATP-dependent carboligase